MNRSALSQIEELLDRLSLDEQLRLLARVSQQVHTTVHRHHSCVEQTISMAMDQQIQDELHRIHDEFLPTETDGLEVM